MSHQAAEMRQRLETLKTLIFDIKTHFIRLPLYIKYFLTFVVKTGSLTTITQAVQHTVLLSTVLLCSSGSKICLPLPALGISIWQEKVPLKSPLVF